MTEQKVIEAAKLIKKNCQTTPCPQCAFYANTCRLVHVLPFAWDFEEDDDEADHQGVRS